jgi:cobalt/nickel transport system permease protein
VLQAVLFGYGGLTVLGVNTVVMGFPALCCYLLLNPWIRSAKGLPAFAGGFIAGMLGILGGCLLLATALVTTGQEFGRVALLVIAAHQPVAVVEGLVTGAVIVFLLKVRPEILEAPLGEARTREAAHA